MLFILVATRFMDKSSEDKVVPARPTEQAIEQTTSPPAPVESTVIPITVIIIQPTTVAETENPGGAGGDVQSTPSPTAVPTLAPTATPEPTAVPTLVPTATPEPTAVPTLAPTATPEPTSMPTLVPTVVPTPISEPTTDPMLGTKNLEKFMQEINKMLVSRDILIDRGAAPKYDLYTNVSTQYIKEEELFGFLRLVFTNNIAHWISMNHYESTDPVEMLRTSLDSSICSTCGKPILKNDESNVNYLDHILSTINKEQYHDANQIMLDYLYEYTNQSDSGSHERLLIICND